MVLPNTKTSTPHSSLQLQIRERNRIYQQRPRQQMSPSEASLSRERASKLRRLKVQNLNAEQANIRLEGRRVAQQRRRRVNTNPSHSSSSLDTENILRRNMVINQVHFEQPTNDAEVRSMLQRSSSILENGGTSRLDKDNHMQMQANDDQLIEAEVHQISVWNPPAQTSNNVDMVHNRDCENHRRGRPVFHNISRSYNECRGTVRYTLPAPTTCPYCYARLFHGETSQICCKRGALKLPPLTSPPEMLKLFSAQTPEGRHFRQFIRVYNNAFAFTSMGVHYDQNLAGGSEGVYSFRAQGAIYHRIGSLVPMTGQRTRYAQSYIVDTDLEVENRLLESNVLHRNLVVHIRNILQKYNPFVATFEQLGQRQDLPTCKLVIKQQAANRHQYSLPTTSQVAAVIVDGEDIDNLNPRDIIVKTVEGSLRNIPDTAGYYDPLQYVILLPYGSYGWDVNSQNNNGGQVTCRAFYAYMLQIRPNDTSLLLRGGRLLQQYVVDNYVKIETHRLRWIRDNQDTIRADLYKGLQDYFSTGENNADNVGRTSYVLPSSFPGSHRDQHQRYQDSMALVHKYGMPDLMITITCNQNWPEIKNELLPGQSPQDRPDLLSRIFRAKLEEFKNDIIKRGVLGKVVSYSYVVEYQKRGLPHAHMLVILAECDKLRNPNDFDKVVRAEIPSKVNEPLLHEVVLKHMIHGPHGKNDRQYTCMKDGTCKKKFPKEFCSETRRGNDSYPIYRRRSGPPIPLDSNNRKFVDNGWVVPYNSWLLLKYDCHINVEVTSSISCVKYLYKYVYKGVDRIMMEVRSVENNDEIQQFVDGRWICAPEALWHIYGFEMSRMYPSVFRLQIHLPNMQSIRFRADQRVSDILEDERNVRTMLNEFFVKNREPHLTGRYLYHEFPEYFVWNRQQRVWRERVRNNIVIGRIYIVSPYEGEKFFLRILLNHVRGPRSFEELRTVDDVVCATFKESAERRGILKHDDYVRHTLIEASRVRMPSALRRLFVSILVTCQPTRVSQLWEEFHHLMMEDYGRTNHGSNSIARNMLIREIGVMLSMHGKYLTEYDLPTISEGFENIETIPKIIMDELSIPISDVDLNSVEKLNPDQLSAYNIIMEAVEKGDSKIFFIDGPGGTGKTFLYKSLLANVRQTGKIVIAVASSGIAATGLPGGRTAHSRFKVPLKPDSSSSCDIKLESDLAELMRRVKVIVWDEAPMTNKYAFEALDKTLKDIMKTQQAFGGKIVILGGDFRQVLPIVKKGNRCQQVAASITKSTFWQDVQILRLKCNMRSLNDNSFSEYLLRVGDGQEPTVQGDFVKLPSTMVIPWESEESLTTLIDTTFPNMNDHMFNSDYMVKRAIITPKNADVDRLNEIIIRRLSGDVVEYTSWDSVEDDVHNLYQPEFLNSLCPSGLPPNKLILKVGCPVMLLRNLDPQMGLCNGTRMICRSLSTNFIDSEILTGHYAGTRIFLHRMPLNSEDESGLPFVLKRIQFPVRVSFALTINKSQGQTIPNVGIFLRNNVFGHGQLYVALSRGVSEHTTKILVKNGKLARQDGVFTMNVVYKEALLPTLL